MHQLANSLSMTLHSAFIFLCTCFSNLEMLQGLRIDFMSEANILEDSDFSKVSNLGQKEITFLKNLHLDSMMLPPTAIETAKTCALPREDWGSVMDWRVEREMFFETAQNCFHEAKKIGQKDFNICEVGFGPGYSAILFLVASTDEHEQTKGGVIHEFTLDIEKSGYYKESAACSKKLIHEVFGESRANFSFGQSADSAVSFRETHGSGFCDIIHIDGDHNYEGVRADIQNFLHLADEKTRFLFDDLSSPGVKQAVDEFVANGLLSWDIQTTSYAEDPDAVDGNFTYQNFREGLKTFGRLRLAKDALQRMKAEN